MTTSLTYVVIALLEPFGSGGVEAPEPWRSALHLRVEALMILLAAAAIVGGLVAFAVLWQLSAVTAFVGAPLCGSFSALIAGLVLAFRRARAERKHKCNVVPFRGAKESTLNLLQYPFHLHRRP